MESIAVVGASLAGFNAAVALRRAGFEGTLTMVGAEAHRPYDRPPLSKGYLAGDDDRDRLQLPGMADADDLELTWRLGSPATALDLASGSVALADGSSVDFDGVVIATGGNARSLPGSEGVRGVHELRTLDDSDSIRADLDRKPNRVVVIGAGFIGAEVAATCRERGFEVTMIEAAPVPLERAVGAQIGELIADVHREHGVDVRVGVGVEAISADDEDRVRAVELADGTSIDAELVVVGIGVAPAVDWLADSGLEIDDGVVCDETCRAAPGVVATGDVARWPNPVFDGELMRVEHWDNAIAMGAHAARTLLADEGEAEAFATVPWFWSDQYDREVQLTGRVRPDDELAIIDGSMEERRFAAIFGRDDRIVGVFGMNRPRPVMQYRMMIENRTSWSDALAASR